MSDEIQKCPLCDRELPESEESKHHLKTKLKAGAKSPISIIHRICHVKIHSVLTESECNSYYHTIERLKEHPDIKKFIKWVSKKDPYFYDSSKEKKEKKKKRKGKKKHP